MTEEEKLAEEYAKLNARQYIHNDGCGFCTSEEEVKQAFLAGLKAREKENAELKEENEEMKKDLGCETCQIHLEYMRLNNKITELEEENKELHQKIIYLENDKEDIIANWYCDRVGKCKVAELEKENAELREKLDAIRNAKDKYDMSKDKSVINANGAEYILFCDLERILEDWQEDDELTKAKEIIKEWLRWANDDIDSPKFLEIVDKSENFIWELDK